MSERYPPRWAIDANALIAFRNREAGWLRVKEVVRDEGAVIGAVNFSEVARKIIARGGDPGQPLFREGDMIPEWRLSVLPFDRDAAIEHARLEHLVMPAFRGQKSRPTYEDLALLAVAAVRGLRVLTSDSQITPAWIDVGVEVEHFRPWKLAKAPPGFPKKLR